MMYEFSDIGDAYHSLGLEEGVTKYEVKSTFRKLAHKYHPDSHGSREFEDLFKEVVAAKDYILANATFDPADDGSKDFYQRATGAYEETVEEPWRPYTDTMSGMHGLGNTTNRTPRSPAHPSGIGIYQSVQNWGNDTESKRPGSLVDFLA